MLRYSGRRHHWYRIHDSSPSTITYTPSDVIKSSYLYLRPAMSTCTWLRFESIDWIGYDIWVGLLWFTCPDGGCTVHA